MLAKAGKSQLIRVVMEYRKLVEKKKKQALSPKEKRELKRLRKELDQEFIPPVEKTERRHFHTPLPAIPLHQAAELPALSVPAVSPYLNRSKENAVHSLNSPTVGPKFPSLKSSFQTLAQKIHHQETASNHSQELESNFSSQELHQVLHCPEKL